MADKKSNGAIFGFMAATAMASGGALLFFPTAIPETLKIPAWGVIGLVLVISVVLTHLEKTKQKLEAQKKLEKQRLIRSKHRKQEQEKREKKIDRLRENLVKQEEKNTEKWEQVKSELVQEAGTVWAGRIEHAEQQENLARKIVKSSKQMQVRNAAGQLVLLWHETSSMAQWTAQQIIMFSQRPNVTTKAREEAQEAIVEAAEIKEKGGNWTKEKGLELAKLKQKARDEAKIEEQRLDSIKNIIENAEVKWRSSENQIRRWQEELDKVYTSKN